MLGGKHARPGLADKLVIISVTMAMLLATFAYLVPPPAAEAALGLTSFEIGSEEPNTGSIAGLVQGSPDWASLTPDTNGVLVPGEVLIINDENNTQGMGIVSPATEATVESNCDSDAEVILNQGQDINSYPFVLDPSGSVPDKVNICQVYVSYDVAGGDTILYVGVTRLKVTGTVALAIELNRVAYNDRKVNDLLVTFEFDGGGSASDIRVRKWTGSAWSAPVDVPDDGDSYQHFGEIAVNLSASDLLPPPTTADDCSSFSSIAPYGFRGESDSSQVGDWAGSTPVKIPRCGELKITKVADPSTDLEFGWTLDSSFPDLTGNISDGETITLDLNEATYSLDETTIPSPYQLDSIVCNDGAVDPDSISIQTGISVHCYIYNVASSVIVKKTGEGDPAADFAFSVTGQPGFDLSLGETSETFVFVPGSNVDISESLPTGPPAWQANGVVCKNEAGDTVASSDGPSIAGVVTVAGDTITCTFTNTQDALLTLEKSVINDHGGTAIDTDWTLNATGQGVLPDISGAEGAGAVTNANVPAGSYDLLESNGPGGYNFVGVQCDGGSLNNQTLTLSPGDDVTCVFTNDDVPGTLTLLKTVNNNHGGTAGDTDFTLNFDGDSTDGSGVEGSAAVTNASVEAGSYDLTESGPFGYEQVGSWDCDSSMIDSDTVTVALGENVTCEVTNQDISPTLTLVKQLINDNGGNATLADFILSGDGPTPISGVSGTPAVTNADVDAGGYDLSESGPAGYSSDGVWVCLGGDQTDGDSLTLGVGESATCTITNDDEPAELIVVKEVINDNGGTAIPGAFQLKVNEVNVNQGAPVPGIVSNTEYTVSEDQIAGYSQTDLTCVTTGTANEVAHPVTLDEGESVTCTITNDDVSPTLTLEKEVLPMHGGLAADTDWTLSANGPTPISGSEGSPSVTSIEVDAGSYDLSESGGPSGWIQLGEWSCNAPQSGGDNSTVEIALGATVTCVVTNTDLPPGLTVIKEVDNNHGGNAVPGDFQLYVNGEAVNQNEALDVDANVEYTVTEDQLDGYALVGIVCEDSQGTVDHPVNLELGQAVVCTVTNEDIAPDITVIKDVTNDDGGLAQPGDFQLYVNGGAVDQNVILDVESNSEYTVSEDQLDGYVFTGIECVDNDTDLSVDHPFVLVEGQSVTCIVSNDDAPASITVIKVVVPEDAAEPDDFGLTLTPEGGDAIDVLSGIGNAVAANETYTVGETLLDGFVQLDLVCEDADGPIDHPVALELGQNVTCTVTNAESPTVTVIKTTQPESSSLFEFNLAGSGFSDDQNVAGDGGSYTWEGLEPGSYDLTENTPVDWLLEGVDCDADFEALDDGAGFDLDYGDHITCVFGNGELGSVTVIKVTDVATDDLFEIAFNGDAESVDLTSGGSFTWDLLVPGDYSLTELLGADQVSQWVATVSCDTDYGTAVGDGTLKAELSLAYGDHVTCTFTNTAQPSDLEVTKIDLVDPVTLDTDNPTALITYEVTVTNNGPAVAENVIVTDTLPATLTFVSAVPEVGSCGHAGGIVTCNLGDMAVGAVVKITIVVETEPLGEVTDPTPLNVVEVSSDTVDNDLSNNVDDEETNIIEVLDVVILPFTGVNSDFLFVVGLGLAAGGALLIWVTRRREEEQGLDH
jgi:uncharacterized repeat protein (TIGR01451 family)